MKQLFLSAPNLKVWVTDDVGRTYMCIPAAAVLSRSPFDGLPEPADAPPGKGLLYVLLVRGPDPPPDDELVIADNPHRFVEAIPPLVDNRCVVCLKRLGDPIHT